MYEYLNSRCFWCVTQNGFENVCYEFFFIELVYQSLFSCWLYIWISFYFITFSWCLKLVFNRIVWKNSVILYIFLFSYHDSFIYLRYFLGAEQCFLSCSLANNKNKRNFLNSLRFKVILLKRISFENDLNVLVWKHFKSYLCQKAVSGFRFVIDFKSFKK